MTATRSEPPDPTWPQIQSAHLSLILLLLLVDRREMLDLPEPSQPAVSWGLPPMEAS